jgi:hypothetical protein
MEMILIFFYIHNRQIFTIDYIPSEFKNQEFGKVDAVNFHH